MAQYNQNKMWGQIKGFVYSLSHHTGDKQTRTSDFWTRITILFHLHIMKALSSSEVCSNNLNRLQFCM